MTPPHSPLIMGSGGGGKEAEEDQWNNPKLMKNISSLSPIICVYDNSAPSSYEGDDDKGKENRVSVGSEGEIPSPNTSQLYKQVSRSQEDRSSNGSDLAESEDNVVLRRDFVKQESKLNLLEEMDVQKYLVMKKENEDGPDIKGGHLDALIILATKVEKITENGE